MLAPQSFVLTPHPSSPFSSLQPTLSLRSANLLGMRAVRVAFGTTDTAPMALQPTHLVLEAGSSSLKVAAGALDPDGKPKQVFLSSISLPTSKPVPTAQKIEAFQAGVNTLAKQFREQFPQTELADIHVSSVATGPYRQPAFMQEVSAPFNEALQTFDPRLSLTPITGRQEGSYYFRSAHQGFLQKHPEATLPGTHLLGMDMGGYSTELVIGTVPPNGHSPKKHVPSVPQQRVVSVDLGRFNHANGNVSSFDYATLKALRLGVKRQVLAAMTQDKQHWWEHIPLIGNRLALRAYQHPDFMFSGSSSLRKDFAPLIQNVYGVSLDTIPLSQAMIKHYLDSPQALQQLQAHAQTMNQAAQAKGKNPNKFDSLGTELALVEGLLEAMKVKALYVDNYGSVREGVLLSQLDAASTKPPHPKPLATLA